MPSVHRTKEEPRDISAGVLARIGDISGSQKLVDGLAKEFTTDTILNRVDIPATQAFIELQQNNPQKAIALMETARTLRTWCRAGRGRLLAHLRSWRSVSEGTQRSKGSCRIPEDSGPQGRRSD